MPAYDLMPMGSYSPFGYMFPQGANVEIADELKLFPIYRSKSVEKTLEE